MSGPCKLFGGQTAYKSHSLSDARQFMLRRIIIFDRKMESRVIVVGDQNSTLNLNDI